MQEWAREMIQSGSKPSKAVDYQRFLRKRLEEALSGIQRPVYRVTLTAIEMSDVVRLAIGKNTV